MVERSLSMREALGSMPSFSILGYRWGRHWHDNDMFFMRMPLLPTPASGPAFEGCACPQPGMAAAAHHDEIQQKWTHWGLNPGPSACEADVIPLHHVPGSVVCMVDFHVTSSGDLAGGATQATPRGFEPLRAEPNGFRVHLLNRSDTVSWQQLRGMYTERCETLTAQTSAT